MPCRVDESLVRDELRTEANGVTRMLCSVMGVLEKQYGMGAFLNVRNTVPGLKEWWERHQEQDRERLQHEIISKLRDKSLDELQRLVDEI